MRPRKASCCIPVLHRLRSVHASVMTDWPKLHLGIEIEVTEVRLLRRLAVGLSLGLQGSMYLVSDQFMQFEMIEGQYTRYR